MEELLNFDTLLVRQQKEWGEILSGFETKNRYVVHDRSGNPVYGAGEVGGSFVGRQFLKQLRPFTVQLASLDGRDLLTVERPFRFYFHEARVYDAQGALLGSVVRQFDWLRRVYSVRHATGGEVCQLFGPVFHPWTFNVMENGRATGKIAKQWSGLLKEAFTDADTFGVQFPAAADAVQRALLLGAVFLIDFVHFEQNHKD